MLYYSYDSFKLYFENPHYKIPFIQVDIQNIIYCLGYHYQTNNLFKQQILIYNIKNFPLKITEPRYFSKISWKLRFQPIERLNELL